MPYVEEAAVSSWPQSVEYRPPGTEVGTILKFYAIAFGLVSLFIGALLRPLLGPLPILLGLSLAGWLYMAKGKVSRSFAFVSSAVVLLLAFFFLALLFAMISSK
nr:hypothetical protein [uncultured Rhodoferax sp.]